MIKWENIFHLNLSKMSNFAHCVNVFFHYSDHLYTLKLNIIILLQLKHSKKHKVLKQLIVTINVISQLMV